MSSGFSSSLLASLLLVLAPGIAASDAVAATPAAASRPARDTLPAVPAAGAPDEPAAWAATLPQRAGLRVGHVAPAGHGWIAAGTHDLPEETGGGMGLVLFSGSAEGPVRELPAPAAAASLLHDPEPLLASSPSLDPTASLEGLAWLEGEERGRLAVRFARLGGDGWSAPVTVAPPGPGSQLALSAARLGDGTALLVWSRFDGEDDEIFWSATGADGGWSTPRRIAPDDAVPDVTPVVTAVPGGAVAAWSGFSDGAYRVFVAHFDGAAWSAPRPVGEPGSVLPSFEAAPATAADPALLLYRTARPRGWAVVELDVDGVPRRHAHAAVDDPQRPRVVEADGAGAVLDWPAAPAAGEPAVRGEIRAGSRLSVPWSPFPGTRRETGGATEVPR